MAEEVHNEYNLKDILGRTKFDVNQDLIIGQVPTLKFMALNRISITLWSDQLCRINTCLLTNRNIKCRMEICENKILERISKFLSDIPIMCKVPLEQRINCFMKKLTDFFIDQKHFKYFTSLDMFNNYWDNICFTQQGTINYVKTAAQLIDNTSLNITDKYIMACDNCLEAKIRTLLKLLPKDFIESYDNNDDHLPIFWIFYIKGELENFPSHINNNNIWNYILCQAINSNNEVAVKYIWENFASEEIKENIDYYAQVNLEKRKNINICLYFFQQMNEIHVSNLTSNSLILLLVKLNTISKWYDVPLIANYIHDLIRKYDYYIAFEVILYCWHEKIITWSQYLSIFWDEVTRQFKLNVEERFERVCSEILDKCLLKPYDIRSIELFIKTSTPENKMKILDQNAIKKCVEFFCIGGPNLLDSILMDILGKEEKISELKRKIFDESRLELCVRVTANLKYDWINKFLSDYVTQDIMNDFKEYLPLKNYARSIDYISDPNKNIHKFDFLTALDNFLAWCFNENNKEIERFKELVFDVDVVLYSDKKDIFFNILYELVLDNNWELVEKYIKWIFFVSNSKNSKRSANEKLTRTTKILNLISQEVNIHLAMRFIAEHELLMKSISSCFQDDEVKEIKEILICDNYLINLARKLMELSSYQKLDKLLYWCCSDDVKINEFKAHFFIDSHGCLFLYLLIKQRNQNIGPLFKWFNLTRESANLFRSSFITFVIKEKKVMSKLFKIYKRTNGQFKEFWKPLEKGVVECLQILGKCSFGKNV